MRRILVLASASLVFGLSQSATAQQNPNLEQGLKPFGSYQSGDVDSVSLTNGNLALHIPLVSYPQRGGKLKLGFLIRYNNKGWQVQQFTSGGQTYQHWVWQGSGAEVVRDQELRLKQTTLRVTDQITFEQVFVTLSDALSPDGSSHQLETVTNGTTAEAVDTSGIALNTALVDRDGIRYTQGGGSASLSYATVVEDPNGNKITAGSNGWTDTLGRLIPGSIPTDSSYGASGNGFVLPGIATADVSLCPSGTTRARNWYLPGPSGGSSLIKLCYTSISTSTQFGITGVLEGAATDVFLTAVVLPNNTSWQFSYNSWGDLSQITFPTGGTLSYAWTSIGMCNGGAGLTTKSRAVNTRSLNANDGTGAHTWTYNWPGPLVTDPLGNDTAYTVGGVVGACSFFVLQEKYYQGAYTSNNLLKTVTRSYSSGIQNPRISYTGEDTAVDVVESAVTTTWANGKTAQVTLQYDSGNTFTFYDYVWETTTNYPLIYGSVTQSTGSDYGPNSQPGPVIHKVVSQYLWNSDSTYRDANLLNLPSSTQVL